MTQLDVSFDNYFRTMRLHYGVNTGTQMLALLYDPSMSGRHCIGTMFQPEVVIDEIAAGTLQPRQRNLLLTSTMEGNC